MMDLQNYTLLIDCSESVTRTYYTNAIFQNESELLGRGGWIPGRISISRPGISPEYRLGRYESKKGRISVSYSITSRPQRLT